MKLTTVAATMRQGIGIVLSGRGYKAGLAVLGAAAVALYSYLLSFSVFNLSGLHFLGIGIYAFAISLVLGIMLALLVLMNVYAVRMNMSINEGIGVGAVASSFISSMVCCTALVPSILSAAGASTATIFGTVGRIQGPLAELEPLFIAIAVVLLLVGIYKASESVCVSCKTCAAGGAGKARKMQWVE